MACSRFTVTVLGGCGFLASHLLEALRESPCVGSITAVDALPSVPPRRAREGVDYRLGIDVGDGAVLERLLVGSDVVINTVGAVDFSRRSAARLYRTNSDLAVAAALACRRAGAGWLVHVSSVAALGFPGDGAPPVDEEFLFDWSEARRQGKHYMLSKHEGDLLLSAAGGDFPIAIVCPGLMIGPLDTVATPMLVRVAAPRLCFVPPGGTNVVDVRDVAMGLRTLVESGPLSGRLIFGGENVLYSELAERGRAAVGMGGPVFAAPSWPRAPLVFLARLAEALAPGPIPVTADNFDSMFRRRYFSSARAEQTVGYSRRYSLEDSFRDYLHEERAATRGGA